VIPDQETSGNYNEGPWTVYKLTTGGEDWLLENQDRLELRREPKVVGDYGRGITDDEVPF
jgi:hypothetical protein